MDSQGSQGFLLDTLVWFWHATGSSRLPPAITSLLTNSRERCFVSAAADLELSLQVARGRVKLPAELGAFLASAQEKGGFRELPITRDIVVKSAAIQVPGDDLVDRLLVATALVHRLELVTLEPALLAAEGLPLWREPKPEAAPPPPVAPPPAPAPEPVAAPQPAAPAPPLPEPPRLQPRSTPAPGWAREARVVSSEAEVPRLSERAPAIRAIPQHPVAITEDDFRSLGLSEPILASVKRVGFEHPTPIQAAVIPPALAGRDIIGLAQTGSGKTAAFCLPLAEKLTHGRGVRGLILSPTREIALQTKAFLDLFGQDHDLETACLIGGVRMGPQIDELRGQPDILVATPGRLLDHIRRRNVKLSAIEELVLDEADHMLDLGFLPQIQEVLEFIPPKRRTMMFSATMPEAIGRLVQRLMTDPVRIDILPQGRTAEGISHRLYFVAPEDKQDCLLALLQQELGSTLVFIRRKIDAEWLCKILEKQGHPVERIHSDLSQGQRVQALEGFREGQHRILVATDIAARGIDVPRIQHIINFELPESVEDYIHRAGRTARGRLQGTVSSICSWQDKMMIKEIEDALGKPLPRCTVPGVEPWEEMKTRPRGRHRLPVRRRV